MQHSYEGNRFAPWGLMNSRAEEDDWILSRAEQMNEARYEESEGKLEWPSAEEMEADARLQKLQEENFAKGNCNLCWHHSSLSLKRISNLKYRFDDYLPF